MSRRWLGLTAGIAALAGQAAPAQESPDATTATAMDRARAALGPVTAEQQRKACKASAQSGEIVVCAKNDEDQQTPSEDADTDTGASREPHVGFRPGGFGITGCFIQRCPPPIYYIDLATIPKAPPGSDADKVAKGEMADR